MHKAGSCGEYPQNFAGEISLRLFFYPYLWKKNFTDENKCCFKIKIVIARFSCSFLLLLPQLV